MAQPDDLDNLLLRLGEHHGARTSAERRQAIRFIGRKSARPCQDTRAELVFQCCDQVLWLHSSRTTISYAFAG